MIPNGKIAQSDRENAMTHRLAGLVFAAIAMAACAAPPASTQTTTNAAPDAVRVLPAAAGWNEQALADVLSYVESQKTTGFLIIDNERIITERNWPLPADAAQFKTNFTHGTSSDGALIEDVASQQKSFIAILVGVGVDKKLIDLSKPVSDYIGAGWSKASAEQEKAITVRHLLEMNSGLKEDFNFEAPAGQKFFYNTPVYASLKGVLEKASGKSLDAVTREWLTAPVGMKDTAWRARNASFAGAGNPTGLATTPRDIGLMGQLVLDKGKAMDGTRVISAAQLDAMFVRTSTNPAYGRLWWLNGSDYIQRPNGARIDGQLIPAAPRDLVAAQGAQDRKLFVVPSRKLVVVRTGQAAEADFNQQLWTRLAKAMPAR
jgi:CubicO group peptidase (beta-lactamase class C family)